MLRIMDTPGRMSRQQISDAVEEIGWRYVLGVITVSVRVDSLSRGAEFAARAVAGAGSELRVDLRHDRVVLSLQDPATAWVTADEIDAAHRITALAAESGLRTSPALDDVRSVQLIEIAIDAIDIASIRPFWKAIMGYADEADATGPQEALVDPWGAGPASGSSRWTHRDHNGTGSTSTCRCPTTRPGTASTRRLPLAASCSPARARRRSGCWPTRRATKRA